MDLSQKQVIETLYELEHQYRLFEHESAGIRYWKLVRFVAFRKILQALGFASELTKPGRTPSLSRELRSWSRNIDFHRPQGESVIYEFFRKSKVDSHFVDPYTDGLNQILTQGGHPPILIESDQLGHMGGFHPRRYAMKRQYLVKNRQAERWVQRFEDQWDMAPVLAFEQEVTRLWQVSLPLRKMIVSKATMFAYSYCEDRVRLERIAPKDVFLLPSYNSEGRIQAARDLGIRTTEMQHGTINPMHFGYHFDATQAIPYLPDRFFCFSKAWMTGVSFGKVEILEAGDYTPFHRGLASQEKSIDLVVISQWIISRSLWSFVVDFARARPDLSIVYKAHPRDVFLGEPHGLANLRVETKESLYSVLARSRQALGVYSTGVYEALLFGCRPVLYNLPGIEMMESFCEVTGVRVVDSVEGLSAALAETTSHQRLDPALWYPPSRLKELLETQR